MTWDEYVLVTNAKESEELFISNSTVDYPSVSVEDKDEVL